VRRQWFCPDPRLPIAGLSYGNGELEVHKLVQARQLSLGAYPQGYVDLPNLNRAGGNYFAETQLIIGAEPMSTKECAEV
jgi:hypothetical protein